MPFNQPSTYEEPAGTVTPSGTGTQDDPYNVAAAIKKCKELGTTLSEDKYYVKGYVTQATKADATYGNATFTIADAVDGSDLFTCYQIAGENGQKLTAGYEFNVGDVVTVYGKIYNYSNKTPETEGKGAAWLVAHEKNGEGGGKTTDAKKVTIAEFNAAEVDNDTWYELTGTVKNLKDGDQYGNFDLEDATGSVYVYGLLSEKGGAKKLFQDLVKAQGIANGSKITIMGNRGEYKGNAQVTNAYFVSVDNSGSGGGETTPSGSGNGTEKSPYNVTAAKDAGEKTGVYVKGYIVGFVNGQVYADGATFSANGAVASNILLAASADETDASKCMPIQLPSGSAVRTALNLIDNAGNLKKEVTLYGDLAKYFGQAGLKNVTFAILNGTEIGKNPNGSGSTANHGTAAAPLTVAQAINVIDTETTASDCYVKGIICQIDSYNSTYKSITYWISDDGGTTTKLQVYSGKGLNGADFTAKEDLQTGKTVIIKGDLKKYNDTYEFDKTSSIISIQ